MSHLIKGILTFPSVFTPKVAQGATDAKYSCALLLAPTDPQVQTLLQAVEQAKADSFPNGYTGTDECFALYDQKYAGKDYYDPRFSGYYVFSCSAKADDKPSVVDMNRQPIVDPSTVYSGCVAYVHAGISGYTKGRGGIGGWLNGVMVTEEPAPFGRLDGKPTVDQMFQGAGGGAPAAPAPAQPVAAPQPVTPAAPAQAGFMSPPAAPQPVAPAPVAPAPVQPVAPPPAQLVMTAAANGATLEQYLAAGYTEEMLVQQGLAIRPSYAQS